MIYVVCSGFITGNINIMGSWVYSYNPSIKWVRIYGGNSPMLGSIFFLTRPLMGSVFICHLILRLDLLHVAPLISHISP